MMTGLLESILIPLGAIVLALLTFAVFIAFAGVGPSDLFSTMYRGAFGTWFSWQNTLVGASPLMLSALCTALPARIGLIVIGGEGAVVVGGMCTVLAALGLPGVSPVIVMPLMLLAGAAGGGLWITAVGALKYYRGVNETISSLLFNYIAIAVMNFLVVGVMKDPSTLNKPSTYPIGDENMIGQIDDTSIHWGLAFGVVTCLTLWFLMRRTIFGFAVDITGGNVKAAKLFGLPVARLMFITCFLGGAAAGLAGALIVAAVEGRGNSALNAGYGYQGILVAFVARHNPFAIIPVAIMLGGIQASNGLLQRSFDLPDATSTVFQGVLFLFILGSEALYGRRWKWPLPISKKLPAVAGKAA